MVLEADVSGANTIVRSYDEYGMPGSTPIGRFRYTGQAWVPEAGLYYYKARMYSPSNGRFMQTDPIGYADGMNLYRYVGNDPVNAVDPTGMVACENAPVPRENPQPCEYEDWPQWRKQGECDTGRITNCAAVDPLIYSADGKIYHQNSELGRDIMGHGPNEIVVVANKEELDWAVIDAQAAHRLAGINIDFGISWPREQLFAVLRSGLIISVPTVARTWKKNGCTYGRNEGIAPSGTVATIHTHPNWANPFPSRGDYTQASSQTVYGIHKRGAWAIPQGTPVGTRPEVLSGGKLKRPRGRNSRC